MKIKLNEIKTFYINLEKDFDKKKNMDLLLNKLNFKDVTRINGLEPNLDRFVSDRKNLGNIYGCALSHSHALSLQRTPFIILEDDVDVLEYQNEIIVPDDADALYLGNMSWGLVGEDGDLNSLVYEKVEGYEDIYRVFNLLGTHAVLHLSNKYVSDAWQLLNNSYKNIYETIDTINPSSIAPDVCFAKMQKDYNVYAIGTPIFHQTGHYEDQTNKHIEGY